mmetsp:Transcript_44804/g.50793  ORF Transcript_44804/g.50793 Transcript_44804/m.50793 type:complete len:86 (-) Transcript_44804:31-288(-)
MRHFDCSNNNDDDDEDDGGEYCLNANENDELPINSTVVDTTMAQMTDEAINRRRKRSILSMIFAFYCLFRYCLLRSVSREFFGIR